jgi:hypothetical protein
MSQIKANYVIVKPCFSNKQKFTINSSQYIQDIAESTTRDVSTTSREGIFSTVDAKRYSYPLTFLSGR